ncbi:MAG TPA: substrate-binding domain-containing protein, partial [Roseiarcus sp.]|nr:substrate-binding domain-containing protein [Roseiarcus sp.]
MFVALINNHDYARRVDLLADDRHGYSSCPPTSIAEASQRRTPPSWRASGRLIAHPDVVGIGGTDGDSGKGAAIAVNEAGRKGQVKIAAMDRTDDMRPYIEDGTIVDSVAHKSYLEAYLASCSRRDQGERRRWAAQMSDA